MVSKIDSSVVALAIAEETSIGVLPVTPVWDSFEPNSFPDFGGDTKITARKPISNTRQNRKGIITDKDATGGFNQDWSFHALKKLMQGFFFADLNEKANTQSVNGTQVPITGVTVVNGYRSAGGFNARGFAVGQVIQAEGFGVAANNMISVATTVTDISVIVTPSVTAEATPPATARIRSVGFQFASGDASIGVGAAGVAIGTTSQDCTLLGLTVGEWIFLGDDVTTNTFATDSIGYGRVSAINQHSIILDETTFTATAHGGSGKTVRIYYGDFLRNAPTFSAIKRRTYQVERQLGDAGTGVQAEYLVGAVPNDFTMNVPKADKVNVDFTFMAQDAKYNNGGTGVKSGTRNPSPTITGYNTSLDVFRMKIGVYDPSNINGAPLFAYLADLTFSLSNNIEAEKAIGTLGAFDMTAGMFDVSLKTTAYFTTVDAQASISNNANVECNVIFAHLNVGWIVDVPLVTLGGGKLKIEANKPITMDLTCDAATGPYPHTALMNFFPYLPTIAMPVH